jgi:hypothetical protein
MRVWIESGFADLPSVGGGSGTSAMGVGARAARVWLALAVATLWVVGVGSEVAQRREACGLGRCVGVSCFRLGRLQVLVAQARGEWCALAGLVGVDWLVERSPPE